MTAWDGYRSGCPIQGTNAALKGCINDVIGMKAILEEYYGFSPNDIVVLIDTDKNYEQPTGKNIKVCSGLHAAASFMQHACDRMHWWYISLLPSWVCKRCKMLPHPLHCHVQQCPMPAAWGSVHTTPAAGTPHMQSR